ADGLENALIEVSHFFPCWLIVGRSRHLRPDGARRKAAVRERGQRSTGWLGIAPIAFATRVGLPAPACRFTAAPGEGGCDDRFLPGFRAPPDRDFRRPDQSGDRRQRAAAAVVARLSADASAVAQDRAAPGRGIHPGNPRPARLWR